MAKKKHTKEGETHRDLPSVMGLQAQVLEQPITQTLERNYMPYAISVIVSRAIPELDGFKPSHRKLLYTMYDMGLLQQGRTKSANVVGQTMKLNPHGDAAIYDTMVRLSRGYGALLHPLVDSKGNFGKVYSRDMAWAASRYTEVKLEPICAELFRDIQQDTVDFVDNYDGKLKEPTLLPTTFPNILVSANQGIAVGMASSLCGFHLGEVCDTTIALLKNPNHDLMSTLKAPDLSTGGQLLYQASALEEIYRTGRGSFKVRAKWRYLKEEHVVEIYEIPYSTTSEAIMDKVAELMKTGKLKEIGDMRDETDLTGLKLAIDLKRGTDPEKLMAKLFRLTPLMDTQSCNFNVLIEGTPRVLGIRELLQEWSRWRMGCIRRRIHFECRKKQEKLHLLQGLSQILLDIDRAIQIIRDTQEEDQVVPRLMSSFGIDQIQADYVADLRLRHINREYLLKRTQEMAALEADIQELSSTVEDDRRIQTIIIRELTQVKKRYAQPRRTEILYEYELDTALRLEEEAEDYPVHLFLSQEGYLKKITPQSLRMASDQKYKEGDGPFLSWEGSNRDELLIFTDGQQCYKTRVSDFDDSKASVLGDYLPTKLAMDPEERVLWACIPGDYRGHILFFFENGKAARIELSTYQTQTRRKKLTRAFSDRSPIAQILLLQEETDLVVYSSDHRCVILHTSLLPAKATRTTQGVSVLTLKPQKVVTGVCPLSHTSITRPSRYRTRTLPALGMPLREEDDSP